METRLSTCGGRAGTVVLLWKGNRIREEVTTMKNGNGAVRPGAVQDLDVSGITGNPVQGY